MMSLSNSHIPTFDQAMLSHPPLTRLGHWPYDTTAPLWWVQVAFAI